MYVNLLYSDITLYEVKLVFLNLFCCLLGKIKMTTIKKLFFYAFALFSLISIIYGMAYDYMIGAEIHYDFYGAGFVAWLVFFGILKEIFGL